MCEVCDRMYKQFGLKGPHYQEQEVNTKPYRDYLIEAKAVLTAKLDTINMMIELMERNPEVEQFMHLVEQHTKS